MTTAQDYKYLRVTGTKDALVVDFRDTEIFKADVIQGIGRELLMAADLAARIDMPLVLSFRSVQDISSALIGKLILLNRKVKTVGIDLRMRDMSPAIKQYFHKLM